VADNHISEQPIDPELNRRYQQLRAVPPRDPHAAAKGLANFVAEVDEIVKEQGFSHNTRTAGKVPFYQRWEEKWNMSTPRFRTIFALAAVFVTLVVFLFGGAGMTAYASKSALPGDALYGVKTGLEQTRVTLARDAAQKAQLDLAFAERRLDEIARLIASGRYADIAQAVQEYELYVQRAIAELETVAAGDPSGSQELASQVAVLLKRYTETLSGMMSVLPQTAQDEIERAIRVSDNAGSFGDEIEFVGTVEAINADSWVVDGRTFALIPTSEIEGQITVGSLVKVHALQDASGNLFLREVELASAEAINDNDNVNENTNENMNINDNDNSSLNTNDNDNSSLNTNDNDNSSLNTNDNDNSSLNTNDNDNSSLNTNDNDNSSLNTNDNDNSNGNTNDNDNDNDNGNLNTNDNGNTNTNDD
jgi:predicted transcriptional regulator